MPTSTDLPSLATETRRKMVSSVGNVPLTGTRSHTPLVAIRASVGAGTGAAGVVVAGVVPVAPDPPVVGVPAGVTTTPGGTTAGVGGDEVPPGELGGVAVAGAL